MVDLSSCDPLGVFRSIREGEYDVAVDLCGWTGGNFAQAFLSRAADVQVNYLGYFASSGISSMDYWWGIHTCFLQIIRNGPESLWRLPRPLWHGHPKVLCLKLMYLSPGSFWTHSAFGSFNHNRKLSDATLRLWGELLAAVPDSRRFEGFGTK